MFSYSSNIVITGGTFTHVEHHGVKKGLDLLHQEVAQAALHNSGERFDPPKCHPNTRIAVLEKILNWVLKNAGRKALILWLYGPAGAGKSAIAQTIAEKLFAQKLLLASFFFSRTDSRRNHERSLVATIAYQVALTLPETKVYIEKIVNEDPGLFGRSLEAQLSSLVIEPLLELSRNGFFNQNTSSRLIIIDGLDECINPDIQPYILDTIVQSVQHHNLPLLFLITSRPEQHISSAFASKFLYNNTLRLALDDSFLPNEDLRIFLQDSFTKIKQTHPLRNLIPSNWPAPELVNTIIKKSSGQFIYASTVMRHVSSIRHRPTDRLQEILGVHASPNESATPFVELDAIYIHLLSSVSDIQATLKILSVLVLPVRGSSALECPADIEDFFSLTPGEVQLILGELGSVIRCDMQYVPVEIMHASLGDFLLDKQRSRQYHVDAGKTHAIMARLCFQHINNRNRQGLVLQYAYRSFIEHCRGATITDDIEAFFLNFPLMSSCEEIFEASSTGGHTDPIFEPSELIPFLVNFLSYLKTEPFSGAQTILDRDMIKFDEFLPSRLEQYTAPPHLSYVVFLNLQEAWRDYQRAREYRLSDYDRYVCQELLQLREFMLWDCHSLMLQMFDSEGFVSPKLIGLDDQIVSRDARTCRSYRSLLLEYLTDRTRSGKHFLDAQKYATAALCCMEYLCEPPHWPRGLEYSLPALQLGMIYILHLLPRAARTDEFIDFAKTRRLQPSCAANFPEETKLAEKAIADFIAGVPVLPPLPRGRRDSESEFRPNAAAGPSSRPSSVRNDASDSSLSLSTHVPSMPIHFPPTLGARPSIQSSNSMPGNFLAEDEEDQESYWCRNQ